MFNTVINAKYSWSSTPIFLLGSALFLMILLMACSSQQIPQAVDIPPLQSISPIKNHYKDLANLSKASVADKKQLDDVKFPNKKYNWLTWYLNPAYISKDQIRQLMLELKPPANSSEQTRAELDFLLDLQKSRTKEQVEEVMRIHKIVYLPVVTMKKEYDLFFECYEIFGENFDPTKYPATKKLMHNSMKEMRIMEFSAKNHFLRARPRQLEPALQPIVEMNTSSFASGHTLWAYLQAYLFAELIPGKRQAFIDLAYDIGFSREILGVHYPSDEEASRNLSHEMLKIMWKNPKFKSDFALAKEEWGNIE